MNYITLLHITLHLTDDLIARRISLKLYEEILLDLRFCDDRWELLG